ncbi:MAG TPA: PVC-type heme-binding CxxCH protein [Fimbriiglobus sp.]|nr:PVC-type heme-binding CxxCH protein [Fimbriiglobus sp.]
MRVIIVAVAALGIVSRLTAADKPVPTTDAAARMTVPDGFHVTLVAGEPDVVQPIAFTFDDRGRLWVVECLSYPKWRADGTGHDRVTIFEDTDGDGKHDKRTVFLDNGSNLSGIELGFGGVWLCSLPNLIFVPDRDRDDKPDGPPEVLLDGWNLTETKHNAFNSLGWGPDGWLYGCNGIQARSKVGRPGTPEKDRVYLDCGVWRYHPTRKVFEAVAHGTTNPWGLDWDESGEMFITNCVIDHLWHVVPGGHYRRMYGQDANPYVFDLMGPASDHKHWGGGHWTTARADLKTGAVQKAHDDAGGGHAHAGCCVYLGDNFPSEYRNSVFMCNIHGNRLNRDTLHRQGSGYVGKHAKDFLLAHDPWFRGLCVKYGPDGGLYVSDWCDTGECHNYEVVDTTNGRIYRVAYGTPKPWKKDLSKLAEKQLIEETGVRNAWIARRARRVLQERASAGRLSPTVFATLRELFHKESDPVLRLRLLWDLHAVGGLQLAELLEALGDSNEHIRAWAVRLGLDNGRPEAEFLTKLRDLARTESSSLTRQAIASVMQRMPSADRLKVAEVLFSRPEDNADPNLCLMYWYGIQPAVLAEPRKALELVNKTAIGLVRTNIVRLFLMLPNTDPTKQLDQLMPVLAAPGNEDARRGILTGILRALEDRRSVTPPKAWGELYPILDAAPYSKTHELTEAVALLFGDERAISAMRKRLSDPDATAESRQRVIERLAARKTPDLATNLRDLLTDPAVRGAAVRALAAYPDAETPAAVLKAYPSLTAAEKADAVQTLASRKAFATKLLDAIEKGTVPKADVTAFAARQIQALNNKKVSDRLAKVWGTVRAASATRTAQAAKYKTLLTADRLQSADLSHGRAVFTKHCASCHKLFGEGGDVGPELTGSQRANLDYVLENVLDPSAVVPGEYRMTAFTLLDGRTLTGIVRRETPQAVTVRTVNEEVTVSVADLDTRKPTTLSVMPDGLLDVLKEDEVRDLVAYLASPRQVPLPVGGP